MSEEHPTSNIPVYESLSEDEADNRENENDEVPTTEGSVKPAKKGSKRKRSIAWETFSFTTSAENEVKCKKCSYTIAYNSSFGTGNMLKHQKLCATSSDVRQMIISKSQGTMMVHNGAFDPKVFRDMITDAVVRHNLPLQFVEYESIREAFMYANPKATLVSRNTLRSDILLHYKTEKRKVLTMLKNCNGRICLTSDLWTSVATDGYITITAHFISDDWFLHKKLLNFSYMPSPHTGITISDKKFKECIAQVALEKKKGLRQDVPTRWNSTYLMLDGAIYYRRAFTHLALSDSNYKHNLEDAEWEKVEGICKFLGVFYNVTRLFSGTKYPTANLYFPNVFIVQHTLEKAIEDPNYVARSMAIKMQPKFDKYWSEYNMILAIAVVFDPRYKTQFVEFCYKVLYGDNCYQITNLHDILKEVFELYKDRIPTYTVVYDNVPGSALDNQGLDVMKEFDALDNDANSSVEKTELDRYLEEKRLNRAIDINVLDYWSTNQGRFPNLALMARDVLTVPISTVASESAFSVGGRVLDQYRSCLAHNIVESLICTRDWKFNEEVCHNYTLEELTQDITRLEIKGDEDPAH